ncbi:flagellar biosynthetic protein FliO [Peptoanaerobacter stomatis]|uniref:Flagellar biosynthesis protein FliO domain protein n=1 Tax=Peptoanaerobacter stomatis TaxID=796937 RepID=G9XAH1_9FIRM|nr:flagellar biosynthetic protein FliO [Peptoanaerobacter stomatis]EHL16607.1 hypothetical protein HMPREF9629_01154 [Peptoanaerobacter stomatis]EHL19991.1 hypothetical protein HMPREF9628_00988 [Peptoanaerobacter stomatis]
MPKLIVQLVVYTILMIAMIIGLQKVSVYIQNKNYKMNGDREMKILERLILSKDKELFLVQVLDKKYFIGATTNNISILKELGSDNDK